MWIIFVIAGVATAILFGLTIHSVYFQQCECPRCQMNTVSTRARSCFVADDLGATPVTTYRCNNCGYKADSGKQFDLDTCTYKEKRWKESNKKNND